MSVRSIHWHEGMFLWPHQLQQAERFHLEQVRRHHQFDQPHGWGLRHFAWDPKELVNFRLQVQALAARLRDGTPISIPEDATLAALDLKPALDSEPVVTVYLAVPVVQTGKPNVLERTAYAAGHEGEPRFLLDSFDLEDESTGAEAQPIGVRSLNVRLLHSGQDLAGYEVLPIARLVRGQAADAGPTLDTTYIPPILATDAWEPLRAQILQALYDRFGKKMTTLARQVVTRRISFDTQNPGSALMLEQLQGLNRVAAQLQLLSFTDGIHPRQAYLELCRLAGQLAIFSDTRRAPALPNYDHDDLGGCFYAVKRFLESVNIIEPGFEERPFIGRNGSMQVDMEPAWFEPVWDMYIGVYSSLPAAECTKLLTYKGALDMKIGSALRIDAIYSSGFAGLEFKPSPTPPQALPLQPDLVYFQVNHTSHNAEWENVRKSALAVRITKERIDGAEGQPRPANGQLELSIKGSGPGKQLATMRFSLFLVRNDLNNPT